MRIGLAQTKFPRSVSEGVSLVKENIRAASERGCELICFPESIIPGLRGVGYEIAEYDHHVMAAALEEVRYFAKTSRVAIILPMEWMDELGYHIVSFVISADGDILGYQTKNQIDPEEDSFGYLPGKGRHIFEMNHVKFGIVICHEGWRYPETVRWAALKEAAIVFHPQFTGHVKNPGFYNGAMVCRSLENNIYFASVNYALESQEITTSLISPSGERLLQAKPNIEELLVYDIDPSQASRQLAKRFNPYYLG